MVLLSFFAGCGKSVWNPENIRSLQCVLIKTALCPYIKFFRNFGA